jgi:hypothetical protein
MRALVMVLICSSAVLGQAALADSSASSPAPVQTQSTAVQSPAVPAATAQAQSPVTAAPAPTPAAAQSQSADVNLDEVVCRTSAPATGTRLGGGRECHTVREWRDREAESQRILQQQQSVGYVIKGK